MLCCVHLGHGLQELLVLLLLLEHDLLHGHHL
jgi:hypothetical protein